jgi:hypothetical protein
VDGDPTDAAAIGSDYSSCKAGTGPTPTSDPCDASCSKVGAAYLSCSDNACFCPTILASGMACSSCLATVDTDPTDAAVIASDYANCGTGKAATAATGPTPTSDPCAPQCSNVGLALFACFDDACLCPRILASGLPCSSCLATVDADPSDAATLGSFYTSCKSGTGPQPTTDPCNHQCSNLGSAYLSCTDKACICPSILASGLACSSCLATVDMDPTDAAIIASDYALCGAGPMPTATSDPCDPYCSYVQEAYFGCFDDACLCPRLLASALPCSSCLASVDADHTDAAAIGSDYSSCKAGTGPIPTTDACDASCSKVGAAYLSCSDNACFCPTILASGLACSSCLVSMDADPADAATIASDYAGCNGTLPSTQPITATQFTLSSNTGFAANPTSTSKSGARVFSAEVFGAGYIQMIMLIAMVAGLFSVFF